LLRRLPGERFWKNRVLRLLVPSILLFCLVPALAVAQSIEKDACPRPAVGSLVPEPTDLRSENGTLKVELTYTNFRDANGQMHYCYRDANGSPAPNLRVRPGDWLIVNLKNNLRTFADPGPDRGHDHGRDESAPIAGRCGRGMMDGLATNLHFHGLYVVPNCHQDDVLNTLISPSEPPFEYRVQIPLDQPPGVYWYHPHVHGFSNAQVQGGASGALIVEGIERANPLVANLPERVLVIRDQELLTPDAAPNATLVMPELPPLRDPDGDILNTGTGGGKPSRDLSVNFVVVPYPDYSPALIMMRPSERQLWRLLNASAITYLDLRILFNGVPQPMGEVSVDGVPNNYSDYNRGNNPNNSNKGAREGSDANRIIWKKHIDLPPGGRADFIFQGPPGGVYGNLITHDVDTGPAGENDPIRPLVNIIAKAEAPEPRSILPGSPSPLAAPASVWIGDVKPIRERKLYFSERPSDPNNPNSPTVFMLTVDGQHPAPYDPASTAPNLTVQLGDVEDWIIENRTRELHAFHIHQIHFLLEEASGVSVDEPFLRDVVNVPFWNGSSATFPSVKLRMDFRNPRIVGTFVYHCHLLEHEDGGMMGTILVKPSGK
jgi:FtsP/CotA-like multicopper oxidase with cupredoxin domain